MTKHSSLKVLAIITLATGIGRFMGFFREWIMATHFGTSAANDALVMALSLPDIILGIITVSLSTALIPVYLESRSKQGEIVGNLYINNVLVIIIVITLFFGASVYCSAPAIMERMAYGFSTETKRLAIHMLRIFSPMIVLAGISSVYSGYLQARLHFFIPSFISIPLNTVIISATLLGAARWGITVVAWGYLGGTLLQTFIIQVTVKRFQLPFRWDIRKGWPFLTQTGTLLIPVLIGSAVTQVNALFVNFLASNLPAGSVSAYHFAMRLLLFPHSVFIMSLATVAFPSLSQNIADRDFQAFQADIHKWLNMLIIYVLPITIVLVTMNHTIIAFVFEHGRFDRNSTRITSQVLQLLAFGLPAIGMREILNRIFFAIQDTRTPVVNGILTMVINIFLNIYLVNRLGLRGLALAASLSATVTVFLLIGQLIKSKYLQINLHHLWQLGKSFLAAGVMAVTIQTISYYGLAKSNIPPGYHLFMGIFWGCAVYFMMMILFQPSLIQDLILKLKSRFSVKFKT